MSWAEFDDWRHCSMITEDQAYGLLALVNTPTIVIDKIVVGGVLSETDAKIFRQYRNKAQGHVPNLVNQHVCLCYSIRDPASPIGEESSKIEPFPSVTNALKRAQELRRTKGFLAAEIRADEATLWTANDLTEWLGWVDQQQAAH